MKKITKNEIFKKILDDENYYLLEDITDCVNAGRTLEIFLKENNETNMAEYMKNEYSYEDISSAPYYTLLFSVLKPYEIEVHTLGESSDYTGEINSNYKYIRYGSMPDDNESYYIILSNENYF